MTVTEVDADADSTLVDAPRISAARVFHEVLTANPVVTAFPDMTGSEPCRAADADPDDWWRNPARTPRAQHHYAATLCSGCPIQVNCLEWAVSNQQSSGVWGGVWLPNLFDARSRRAALSDARAAVQGRLPERAVVVARNPHRR